MIFIEIDNTFYEIILRAVLGKTKVGRSKYQTQ